MIAFCMERNSENFAEISYALLLLMPLTSASRSGAISITEKVSALKVFTIFFAVTGPTPLMSPEARYFSMPASV